MGQGERNKADPLLIVTEPRVPQPTARAQGFDRQEGSSVLKGPEKAKGYLVFQI